MTVKNRIMIESGLYDVCMGCRCYKVGNDYYSLLEDNLTRYAIVNGQEIDPVYHEEGFEIGRIYCDSFMPKTNDKERVKCQDCPFREKCEILNDDTLYDISRKDEEYLRDKGLI